MTLSIIDTSLLTITSHINNLLELSSDTILWWYSIPFFVVGEATAKAISELNFKSIGAEHSGNADILADYIVSYYAQNEQGLKEQSSNLLFLVGDKRRDAIPNRLSKEGIGLDELLVYQTQPNEQFGNLLKAALEKYKSFDWVVFFSPSGVDATIELLYKWKVMPSAKLAAIGPTTADFLQKKAKIKVDVVAKKPDALSLAEGIKDYCNKFVGSDNM
jgi:uroporphyrinogen-III synthase